MAKTRSQTRNITIKKEEEEYCKPTLGLGIVCNTRSNNKISKRKLSKNRTLPALQVKLEEDINVKTLLQPSLKSSKLPKGQKISQEQINQLIHYIVNDNMNVVAAARKVKISHSTGFKYYNIYKNGLKKRIPLPRDQTPKMYTQEQVGNLIKYINDDKMTMKEASAKTDIHYKSAFQYYNRYLKDPDNNILITQFQQNYTQDQMHEFIDYITNHKMSIAAASKKAKIKEHTGQSYYHNYFKVENPDIARPSHIATHTSYT